jgi:predicted RNA methylase
MIKVKHLEMFLENVEPFKNPKRSLEQYMTQPKNATAILYQIYV